MSTKTTLQQAANKVGVAEEAANLLADHLDKEGFELTKSTKTQEAKGEATLRVQPEKASK